MTAREPGASEVLTVGPTRRPRATAFRASSPAPTMTVGLEVFVQDVIAAIATEPWRMTAASTVELDRDAAVLRGAGRAAFVGQALEAPRWSRRTVPHSGSRPEVRAAGPAGHAVLGPARAGDGRLHGPGRARAIASKSGPAPGIAPEALLLGVALDEVDPLRRPAGQAQVGERLVVDREERRRGPELRAHVADRRPVGERQAGQPVAGELDERPDDAVRRAASR